MTNVQYYVTVQYRNILQTFRNSRVLKIGNFAKRLQTFRYRTQPKTRVTDHKCNKKGRYGSRKPHPPTKSEY